MSLWEARQKLYEVKATVKGYPEIKTKVKVATNLEPWGPTKDQMQEICEACHNFEDKRLVLRALWKRITTSQTKEWPHVYKALAIFEFLLLYGPESIVDDIKEQLYNLRTLHDFTVIDEKGHDRGVAIRDKSKKIVEWVTDPSILSEERKKAEAVRAKINCEHGSGSSLTGRTRLKDEDEYGYSKPSNTNTMGGSFQRRLSGEQANNNKSDDDENDVHAMRSDPDLMQQQKRILEEIEREKQTNKATVIATSPAKPTISPKLNPSPTPAAPTPVAVAAPAPAPVQDLFDPFSDPVPAPPKPPSDITDFFAPTGGSTSNNFFGNDDPFASPVPSSNPSSTPPRPTTNDDDLFASPSNNLFLSPQPPKDDLFGNAASFPSPPEQEKPNLFADSTFDALCNIDNLVSKPQPKASPGPSPTSHAPSLKDLKTLKQATVSATPTNYPPPPSRPPPQQRQDFNPFL